jgi:two-component system, chemotaxis family, CheB/CheR fusion protein
MSELSQASAQVLSSVVLDAAYPQGLHALNMLATADIPVLLVDSTLAIRFMTPAAASLLQLAAADRELSLESLQGVVRDPALLADARLVLRDHDTIERVVAVPSDRWFLRRMAPHRTTAGSCDGLVITLSDITDRERVAKELRSAKQQAEMVSAASMRRLSAVCHDLRQPLNTLGLIGGLLAQSIRDPLVHRLAQLLDDSLQAMSGMLSSAHYACRLSAGSVRPHHSTFSVEQIFARLRREFVYHSGAYGLTLRIASSSLTLRSDPALFEQMLRSMLEQLMKTSAGKVLVGCRRRSGSVRIEFWRARQGPQRRSPSAETDVAVSSAGSEITKKLAELLGYRLRISLDPRWPVFAIEIPIDMPQAVEAIPNGAPIEMPGQRIMAGTSASPATVFVVDDDDDVCIALQKILQRPGLTIHAYRSAKEFLASFAPQNQSCLLVDANLEGMQGIQLIQHLNAMGCRPPTIMISGHADVAVAVEAMKSGALDFVEKPFDPPSLQAAVERALTEARNQHEVQTERQEVLMKLGKLSARQQQVLHLMLEGKSSKVIAAQLFMSRRTVESHRANVMKRMSAKSLPELARMVSVANQVPVATPRPRHLTLTTC